MQQRHGYRWRTGVCCAGAALGMNSVRFSRCVDSCLYLIDWLGFNPSAYQIVLSLMCSAYWTVSSFKLPREGVQKSTQALVTH
jgi:hypothetical protein